MRAWRTARELNLRQAAELLGCSPAYVGALERGEKLNPSVQFAERLQSVTDERDRSGRRVWKPGPIRTSEWVTSSVADPVLTSEVPS